MDQKLDDKEKPGANGSSLIRLTYKLRFEPQPVQYDISFCLVDIMYEILAETPASFPFLAITALGLNIAAGAGWTQSTVQSVRKMQRFTPVLDNCIECGQVSHCCTIRLRYNFGATESVEFERGSEHRLSELPDLNVTYIAGAGNYPSERLKLRVPAPAILALIKKEARTSRAEASAVAYAS